jgi:hypothetical protein
MKKRLKLTGEFAILLGGSNDGFVPVFRRSSFWSLVIEMKKPGEHFLARPVSFKD